MCSFDQARSMASTARRMSAEFLPVMLRRGISISSMAASWSGRVYCVPVPVGVRLLDDDLALFEQPLEDLLDVEVTVTVLEADGEVLEVDEDGEGAFRF